MNKNKKIVALICAMAMIFSMFASFTVVNAEEITKGIVLEYESSSRTADTAVVVAKAVGFEKVDSYTVNINVPDGVTKVTASGLLISGGVENLANGVYGYSVATATAVDVPSDGVLGKFEISLPSSVTDSFDVSLQEKSGISYGSEKLSTVRKNLPISTTTVEKYVDPSITPTPTPLEPTTTRAPKPTKAPVATEDPSATVVPTKAPVEVTKGISLEAETAANGKVAVVAKAVGFEKVDSYTVNINVPDGVTEVTASGLLISGGVENLANGVYGYSVATATAVDVPADGVLGRFEFTLPSTVTDSFDVTLQEKSGISYGSEKLSTVRKNLPLAWTTVKISSAEPTPTAAPSVVGSVALDKLVSSDKVTGENVTNNESDYRIGIVVTKNGAEAEYGTDFIAFYGDNELTEDEYVGLVNGYLDSIDGVTSLKDVIDNITFKTYNAGVKIYAELVNANNEVVDNSTVNADPSSTAKPSEPSISVKASSTTVEFDKKFTVTATVKNAKDGAKVAFTTSDEKYAAIFGTPTEINSKGETKATYVANDKAGTVTITATYTDTEGNEKSASVKVTVKKASTTNGGSSSSDNTSSGGPGIIAGGNVGTVTTPNTDSNYKPDFQDLDSVEWARTAINGLAMRGMISGRDQYTFDPNANITRAEYCQILMGAINALNAKGESTFADVPSTAWYYNAVSVASQLGIVSGYGDGNFGPNDLITRQDMALMTYKTAQIMNKSLEPVNAEITFEDSHEIADYAFEAVMTLQKAGIINGMTDTTFEPLSNATRAQSAKVIFDTFVDAQ